MLYKFQIVGQYVTPFTVNSILFNGHLNNFPKILELCETHSDNHSLFLRTILVFADYFTWLSVFLRLHKKYSLLLDTES